MSLRIATYNIQRGGRARVRLLGTVLEAIDPDVVILQEATDPGVVRELADVVGADVLSSSPGRSVAMLARPMPVDVTWHEWGGGHGVAELHLLDHDIRLFGVHLTAGLSARGERRRALEVDRLLDLVERPPGPTRAIVAGDLNAIAPGDVLVRARLPTWIRILVRIDGGIGTTVIGRLLAEGYTDAYRRQHAEASGATMPAAAPTVRLDYFLLGRGIVPDVTACDIAADRPELRAASDHLPLVLDLEPGRTVMPSIGGDTGSLLDHHG